MPDGSSTPSRRSIVALAPISVIGTAANLNLAIENGLARAAKLLSMTVAEVRNRATVNGAIEIGRAPGVIQVIFLAPLARLDAVGRSLDRPGKTSGCTLGMPCPSCSVTTGLYGPVRLVQHSHHGHRSRRPMTRCPCQDSASKCL